MHVFVLERHDLAEREACGANIGVFTTQAAAVAAAVADAAELGECLFDEDGGEDEQGARDLLQVELSALLVDDRNELSCNPNGDRLWVLMIRDLA